MQKRSKSKILPSILRGWLLITVLVFLSSCNSSMVIVNDVDERSANEIVVFLASKGIVAEKTVASSGESAGAGGPKVPVWNITVDAQQATEAMAILNRNGLPRPPGQTLLDLFSTSGLVPTDMEEQVRYQAGLSEQIASTIRKIDGVIDADVQVSFPAADSPLPLTASVYVKHQGVLDNPNSHLVSKIQQLVSSSVTGLKIENVTVISDRSRFTDISFGPLGSDLVDDDKEYAMVWSVILAKESVGRFQGLFFTFLLIILILAALLIWLLWKVAPLFEDFEGGWMALLLPKPITLKGTTPETSPNAEPLQTETPPPSEA